MAGDNRLSHKRIISLGDLFLKICLLPQSFRSGYAPGFGMAFLVSDQICGVTAVRGSILHLVAAVLMLMIFSDYFY